MSEHTWKSHGKDPFGSDYDVYRVGDQGADELIDLGGQAVLAVKVTDGLHVDFAVFDWLTTDGADHNHIMLFHGSGPSGALRECRHIYWGESGYVHFMNFAVVEAALRELRRWFDAD